MSHESSYGQPNYGPASPAVTLAPNNAYAITSLPLAFIFPILGLIFGIIGRKQIAQTGERGSGFALAGIIIGGIQLVLVILYFILIFAVFGSVLSELSNMNSTSV